MKNFLKYTLIITISIVFGYTLSKFNIGKLDLKDNLNFVKREVATNNEVYAKAAATRDSSQLLARAINGEARGEPYIGQVAVGAVILNRVSHPSFPNTIAGVIYQPGAFTAVNDGQINAALSKTSTVYKAAKDCMAGWDPSGGAIYYYNPAKTTNKWIWSRPVIKVIGKHKFAK